MLRGLDRVLEWVGWLLAVWVLVLLLSGSPSLIGAKENPAAAPAAAATPTPTPTATATAAPGGATPTATATATPTPTPDATAAGRQLFATVGCGSCHTLADAGTNGAAGPNLDQAKPDAQRVTSIVTSGEGAMPAFGSRLSAEQIQALAAYVSSVAGR